MLGPLAILRSRFTGIIGMMEEGPIYFVIIAENLGMLKKNASNCMVFLTILMPSKIGKLCTVRGR